jgi:hypothetical protein
MGQTLAGFGRAEAQVGQVFSGLKGAQREGQQSQGCRIAEIRVGGVEQSEESCSFGGGSEIGRTRYKMDIYCWTKTFQRPCQHICKNANTFTKDGRV